jgi:Tfp pilus assembly protein PilX
LRNRQRGYLLVMVIIMLFLVASIAMLLNHDSAISANLSTGELQATRADYVAQAAMQHALWSSANNACMGDVTIPDTALGAATYSATITGAAAGTLYQVGADQDAWIRSDDVTANNGKTTDQHIRFEGGNIEYALTRFDLSTLPKDAQINSAVAWFYVTSSGPGGGAHPEGPVTVHNVTADWTETGATWESLNGRFDSSTLAIIPAQPVDGIWVSFNLTGQVQAWANGQPNYGILMASSAEGVHGKYASREDGGNAPRLEVVVGSGAASPVTIRAKGTLDNGVKRLLKDKVAVAYQPPTAIALQPGPTDGVDSYIWAANKSTNYGSGDETWIGSGNNNEAHMLFRFNLQLLPSAAKIANATLSLHHRDGWDPNVPVTAHRITQSWNEDAVTWNNRDSGVLWTSPGGDYDPAIVATALVGPGNNTRYEWDITRLAQGWLDGDSPNYGVLLRTEAAGIFGERFDTSDHADPARRPILTVSIACECGRPCTVPNGSGNVLMAVINPTTLVPADAYKKSLFESWGYTVDVISESANAAEYAAKAANNDVAYISETVNAKAVGSKLADVSIGVLNEDGDYNGDLGFESAASSNWPVGSGLKVTDTSHFITAPFFAGALEIYNADMGGLAIGGTPATGVQSLADWGSSSGLAVLEAGAKTADGGAAAGRRVMLPFGRTGQINWSQVNSNGHLILQRSLDWAMNKKSGLRILLVVGIDTALQTRDTARRDLFESWGHTVTIIDDGATFADFDAATALNDVVYVAGTVVDGNLDSKLVKSPLGIVNEVAGQLDDLGFHGNATANTVVSDNFTATGTGHYISEPFGGSGVTHFTTNITMPVAHAPLAPSLGTVAAFGALTWGIPVLDTGAARWDGELSAGRRVHLPFGNAEISQLTADGATLLRRAIEWAGGAGDPAPPQRVLLVVVDPAVLTAQEAAKQALMESWGYTVNLIDESASQGEFDDAVTTADVAYVAEDIASGALGTKLRGATIGVVIEEEKITDEFGISSGETTFAESSIEVTDNTHYITAPFGLGAVTFASSAQPVGGRGGTLAPGLAVLALRPSSTTSMLDVIETGGVLVDTGTAAGRRVKLPWGGNDFDINSLTDDGRTVLQRSLEWGAGANTGPIAHWKFDETSGFAAADAVGDNDGSLNGNANWITGEVGGGLAFDYADGEDYVEIPNSPSLENVQEGDYTLAAWFRPDSTPPGSGGDNDANYGILIKRGWHTGIFFTDQNRFAFWNFLDGDVNIASTSGNTFSPGSFYHVTATIDRAAGLQSLYVNGQLEDTSSFTPGAAAREYGTEPWRIGIASPGATSWGWAADGVVDDVRIYDRTLSASEIGELVAAGGGGGGGGSGGGGGGAGEVVFEGFADTSLGSDGLSITIPKPAGTTSGDLLVAAVVIDGENKPAISAPAGWTLVDHESTSKQVTMDVLWKTASATEPASYDFSWVKSQEAYGWIMRFSGQDAADPVAASSSGGGSSTAPVSPAVTATSPGSLILRIGGFDDDDITPGNPGVTGHTPINMGKSGTGANSASGGAAYTIQATSGDSGTSNFSLTANEDYRSVTIAISPAN